MRRIPKVREYLETDLQAAYDGDPAARSKDEIVFSYPGLYAITVYRLAHELFLLGVPLIPRMMTEQAHSKTGIDIHPGATIGKYFFIDHGTGIVIGETTIIGCHVKLYQGVTLGALSTKGGQKLRDVRRHPTIGDNVTIYSGASILGGETVIEEGVVIGGNSFITQSIKKGTKVSVRNQELIYTVMMNHFTTKNRMNPGFTLSDSYKRGFYGYKSFPGRIPRWHSHRTWIPRCFFLFRYFCKTGWSDSASGVRDQLSGKCIGRRIHRIYSDRCRCHIY